VAGRSGACWPTILLGLFHLTASVEIISVVGGSVWCGYIPWMTRLRRLEDPSSQCRWSWNSNTTLRPRLFYTAMLGHLTSPPPLYLQTHRHTTTIVPTDTQTHHHHCTHRHTDTPPPLYLQTHRHTTTIVPTNTQTLYTHRHTKFSVLGQTARVMQFVCIILAITQTVGSYSVI